MAHIEIVRTNFGSEMRGYSRNEVIQHLEAVAEQEQHREKLLDSLTRELEQCSEVVEDLNIQVQQGAHDRSYLEERFNESERKLQEILAQQDQTQALPPIPVPHHEVSDTDDVAQGLIVQDLRKQLEVSHESLQEARNFISEFAETESNMRHEFAASLERKDAKILETESALTRAHDRIAELEAIHSSDALQAALDRAKRAEAQAEEAEETSRLLKRTLITAQRTADELLEESRFQAATTRSEADEYAKRIRHETDEYAATTRNEADTYSHEVRSAADHESSKLVEDAHATSDNLVHVAKQTAEQTLQEARDNSATIIDTASKEAQEMRDSSQKVLHESLQQAKLLADLRRTYASRARAAIEDQIEEFINVAKLPDFPPELQNYIDLHTN